MKLNITIVLLMILLTSNSVTAQTKEDYLLKSKHQKTAAWILLGGGAAVGITGTILALHGLTNLFVPKSSDKFNSGGALMVLGTAAVIGSIPMFISAARNKGRGMSVSFTNQAVPGLVKNMVRDKYVPSVSLHFKL